ncbi:type II CRISPR-associated endonuclease Cas1 [Natronogracilivirga saccharolytica]|uniref:CRISPR-associated endonuclease Cas1 n=1 Tax=Natronogracilivirga saccharolytica TaxID=2812953 RepID=A0A8J7RJ50_9BACT|nr:type II CRISPR-associated endonuclease Cas1 [Natronogracilivirga saccharolytica]MBP3192730.1 type II CRISPR-associated endonuclease Cas1 [Natronogracilivirga saccharolytica]
MIKKTLFFQSACHLNTRHQQLMITTKKTGEVSQRPIEDLGFVLFDHPQITFTQSVIQLLNKNNTAVIFCDQRHHPSSMLLNLDAHQVQSEHFRAQIEAGVPLKKQLWQQTVKMKIWNQASVLDFLGYDGEPLRYMARKVKSGDGSNEEARAARYYWPFLFGQEFVRLRYGPPPNNYLNYGYTVLRAAVARALAGSGLHPTLGIHHRNKYNAFCLADDIMEPYRPFVDMAVCEYCDGGMMSDELKSEHKTDLLEILTTDVKMKGKKRPLMIALTETTASLVRCLKGEQKGLKYPEV